MGRKLKVAVVGLTIGAGHVSNYAASESVEEILICDVDESKLNSVGEKFGVSKRYTDYDQMLREGKPDAVSVAVPNHLHLPFTCKALKAGAHVLCEKPMARNTQEAAEMLKAAQQYDRKLMINFNQRFLKESQALKAVIEQGRLGEIYYVRAIWQRRRGVPWWYPLEKGKETCGGGPLIDLGVHILDRAMWFCGDPQPEWILGNTFCQVSRDEAMRRGIANFDLEDMAVAMIRMADGTMLELEASWAGNRENEVVMTRLYGSKGGAVLRTVIGENKAVYNKLFLETNGVLEDIDLDNETSIQIPNIRQAFLDSLINDTPVPCSPQQGLKINKILDAIYASAENGKPIAF